jgi:hypothetical protein
VDFGLSPGSGRKVSLIVCSGLRCVGVTPCIYVLYQLPFCQLILFFFRAHSLPLEILLGRSLSLRTFVCYRCFYESLTMGFFSSSLYTSFFLAYRLQSIYLWHWMWSFLNFSESCSQNKSFKHKNSSFKSGFAWTV